MKKPGAKIFKDTLRVFYPEDSDWSTRNADQFYKECPVLLDAIVGFIQQNYTDLISSFPADSVRAVLTSKCSDLRRKVAKELKEKQVIIGSDDDGMLSYLILR